MARLQFGQSHCQIAGTTVPAAEFNLAHGEMVYFSHHVLLWADPATRLQNMSLRGGWKRMMAGLPLIMVEAHGPGHIALSDNHAGEVIALPLQHGQSIWVKEHRFLTATGNVRYDWNKNDVWCVTGTGDEREIHYPMGPFGDTFTAADRPGLLLLHAPGDAFVRDLRQGESLLVQPASLVYRDVSVRVHLHHRRLARRVDGSPRGVEADSLHPRRAEIEADDVHPCSASGFAQCSMVPVARYAATASAMRCADSVATCTDAPARCGVATTFGRATSGSPARGGSGSNTSTQ